jgi:DNA mismatch repair protein MutH
MRGTIDASDNGQRDEGRRRLLDRARSLAGRSVDELARAVGLSTAGAAVRTKGSAGAILERALGATGGSSKVHDFPELAVELKTIPLGARRLPLESTYVCTLGVADADRLEWETSWVRAKLACVLWVPLLGDDGIRWPERVVGEPLLWMPTAAQDDALRSDFDEVVGLIGVGRIEELDARIGRYLQVRPKAAHGRVRTVAYDADGGAVQTVPRGFYLRPRFTGAILQDPSALPD